MRTGTSTVRLLPTADDASVGEVSDRRVERVADELGHRRRRVCAEVESVGPRTSSLRMQRPTARTAQYARWRSGYSAVACSIRSAALALDDVSSHLPGTRHVVDSAPARMIWRPSTPSRLAAISCEARSPPGRSPTTAQPNGPGRTWSPASSARRLASRRYRDGRGSTAQSRPPSSADAGLAPDRFARGRSTRHKRISLACGTGTVLTTGLHGRCQQRSRRHAEVVASAVVQSRRDVRV